MCFGVFGGTVRGRGGGGGVDLMLQFSCVLRALRTYSGNDVYEELIKGLFELRVHRAMDTRCSQYVSGVGAAQFTGA